MGLGVAAKGFNDPLGSLEWQQRGSPALLAAALPWPSQTDLLPICPDRMLVRKRPAPEGTGLIVARGQ